MNLLSKILPVLALTSMMVSVLMPVYLANQNWQIFSFFLAGLTIFYAMPRNLIGVVSPKNKFMRDREFRTLVDVLVFGVMSVVCIICMCYHYISDQTLIPVLIGAIFASLSIVFGKICAVGLGLYKI